MSWPRWLFGGWRRNAAGGVAADAMRSSAGRLQTLHEINRAVSASLDPDTVLATLARTAVDFFRVPLATVWVADDSGAWLGRRATAGETSLGTDLLDRLPFGEGTVGWIAECQMSVISANVTADQNVAYREWALGHGLIGFTGIPLVMGERFLGVLTLNSRTIEPLASDEVAMLQAVAAQAAIAVDNARLFAEARRRAAEYRALFEVGGLVGSTLDVERVLDLIVEHCRALMGVTVAGVFSLDADSGTLVYQRGVGLSPEFVRSLRVRLGEGTSGKAAAQRVPVWSADLLADPAIPFTEETRALVRREGYRAVLSVPILIKGEASGVLAVYWWEPHVPTPSEIELMSGLAAQAAVALDNARLYQAAQVRATRLRTLGRLNQIVSSSLDGDEVLGAIANAAAELMDCPAVSCWVADETTQILEVRAFSGGALGADFPFTMLPFSQGGVGWVARNRRPLEIPDVSGSEEFLAREWSRAHQITSFLGVPIELGDALLGVLALTGRRPFRLGPDDQELLDNFVAQAAGAIRNAGLYAETRRRLDQTRALLEVVEILNSTLDPRRLLRQVAIKIAQVCHVDRCTVVKWQGDRVVPLMSQFADGRRDPALWAAFMAMPAYSPREVPAYAQAIETGRPVVIQDATATSLIPREWVETYGFTAYMVVPLIRQDQVIGVMSLDHCDRAVQFAPWQADLAMAIAGQLALALENSRLYAEVQERLKELSVLHELSRAVTGQLDQAGLLETLHQQVARVLDVRHMAVILHDEERDELEIALRIQDGERDDRGPRRYPSRATGLMSVVLETRRPVRTDDYAAECARRGVTPIARSAALRHWLGVPMAAGDRMLGLLALRSGERAFTERDQRLLGNIADLAALALRSARLFEERTRAYGELAAAQDQLVRTEKLRALGEMASGVAHDFNNLLASILGRAQLLLREVQDPKSRGWLEIIERAALDGAQTVRRLQEFTRTRRDQRFVAVDLNRVVRETLEVTESRWREEPRRRGIAVEVTTSLTAPLPPVAGDPAELREALTNLILNALDAMPRGGVLTLATATAASEVELTVSDTGVGIPEAARQKIFDPFFTTKGPRGTGLGLSMTYGILSRHGARVTVESEQGRGTTFRLTFAVTVPPEAPTGAAPSPAAAVPLRCLVVDDEEAVGQVLADVLISAGHRAVVLMTGAEAVARFRAETFDVVFTDLSMPGLSGWEVAHAIKAMAVGVPIFLVTGFGVEVSREELTAHGVAAVLAKPLRIQDVLGALAGIRPRSP